MDEKYCVSAFECSSNTLGWVSRPNSLAVDVTTFPYILDQECADGILGTLPFLCRGLTVLTIFVLAAVAFGDAVGFWPFALQCFGCFVLFVLSLLLLLL